MSTASAVPTQAAQADNASPPKQATLGQRRRKSSSRSQSAASNTQKSKSFALPVLVGVLILALWWALAEFRLVSALLLPRPEAVLEMLVEGLGQGVWWPHVLVTLQEVAVGFVAGSVIGIVVGAVFAFSTVLQKMFHPYILALMCMPKIAIAPLLIVALGYGLLPKVIIAALLAFFPVMTSAIAGLTNVDPDELNLLKSVKANRWQELRYLRIPNSLSYIFPSFDVAIISALLGAVAAELVGAQAGLGYLISTAQAYGDVPTMYGVFIILAAIGVTLRMLVVLGRKSLPRSFNA
ncbi:ABC transporter permease [Dietzia aurantiaca]|uniref:ABC transporter permease n=1 Tax=Dietzia aurantiaca TaxID=983873 RepID=A0ABV9PU99_9ACTN